MNQSIKRKEKKGLKNEKTQKHSIDDDYKNLEDYNAARKRKVLIMFDDVIWKANKKLSVIVFELFLRGRKLCVSLVFIS